MSDKIDIMMNDGNNISVPSWALETTQKQVLAALISLGKSSENDAKFNNVMKDLNDMKMQMIYK